jgi:hypothetical protein
MQSYRDLLIRLHIWNAEDPRDPGVDDEASQVVESWIKAQVAPFVQFHIIEVPEMYNLPQWYRPLMVWSDGGDTTHIHQEPLPVQEKQEHLDTRSKAICAAALVIRGFLEQHPECAA